MRKINEVIIHCSATRAAWMADRMAVDKVVEIRRWHVEERGWSDIGYHWLIDRNGATIAGRAERRAGAHVKGHNDDTIGVCLIGGHGSSSTDAFSDHFTVAQDAALRTLLKGLSARYPGISKISGHNQYAAKACPGFQVPEWLVTPPLQGEVRNVPTEMTPQEILDAIKRLLKV
jgi:hypothetical protein